MAAGKIFIDKGDDPPAQKTTADTGDIARRGKGSEHG